MAIDRMAIATQGLKVGHSASQLATRGYISAVSSVVRRWTLFRGIAR